MITLSNVFGLLENIHVPSPQKALKIKRQKHDVRHQDVDRSSISLQGISIPEQKMRVGLPPEMSTTIGVSDNINSLSRNYSYTYNNNINQINTSDNRNYLNLRISPQADIRKDLEARILSLFKTVWLGLYQVDDAEGPYHYERIEALYLGAGLTRAYRVGELKVLNRHFSEYSRNNGIAGLKLYESLSIKTLRAIIEVLEAYEKEIPNLERLYTILRESQLELNQVDGFGGYTAHIHQTQRRYLSAAEPLERRLLHYDARMDVLIMDVYDEAMELHVFRPVLRQGIHVYQKAFSNRRG